MFNEEKNLQSLNLYNIYLSAQYEIQSSSQYVATRHSSSSRTNVHIHISSHIMPGRNFNRYICNNTPYIFFTAILNSKLVTTRRGMSQLVMPHAYTHPRFKSCKMTITKISIITFVLQHLFFTAIRNSKLVTARRGTLHFRFAAQMYTSTFQVM
jgi:hypothetical protein